MSRVVTGIPTSWDSCTASVGAISEVGHAVWSPCGQFVAVGMGTVVEVRDSNTLERLSTLKAPHVDRSLARSLSFSPDGRLLACLQGQETQLFLFWGGCRLYVWDIQTGVIISSINDRDPGMIAFSGNRRVVNLSPPSLSSGQHQPYIHDALEGTQPCKARLPWPPHRQLGARWTHGDTLRFAISFERVGGHEVTIEIRELQPTPHPPSLVESFRLPCHGGNFSFSPVSFHASFVTGTDVVILDVRDSRVLLEASAAQSPFIPSGCFSPDGHFFACGTEEPRVRVWENRTTCYGSWSNLKPRLPFKELSFSPTASSILAWGQRGIQLLNPGNQSTFLSPDGAEHHHKSRSHLVAYSADRTLIATARRTNHVIKILDALSGTLRQLIDTGMEILDIKIVDNTICTASSCGVVRWDLGTGGGAHGARDVINRPTVIDPAVNQLSLFRDRSNIALAVQGTDLYLWREGPPPIKFSLRHPGILEFIPDPHEIVDIRSPPNQDGLLLLTHAFLTHTSPPDLLFYLLMKLEIAEGAGFASVVESFDCPWSWVDLFSRGYSVGIGSKEWLVDHNGRKLLWLPPSWRTKNAEDVRWDNNFLAFLDGHHPDPIIIQFCL